jgi:hypothetical protein
MNTMSPDDNIEEPYSDEGEVISGPSRLSYSRKRAVILFVVLLMAVSALSATVAVTVDRAVNGEASPEMVTASFQSGVAVSESKAAEENGTDRLLSFHDERDLASCPVSVVAVGYGPSSSSSSYQCGKGLGSLGCSVSRCRIYASRPVYSASRRRWYTSCSCK